MSKRLISLLAALFAAALLHAQYRTPLDNLDDSETVHALKEHVGYLASAQLEGRKAGGEGNSKRFFLETPEERLAWLRRKGEQGGFDVLYADEMGGRIDIRGRRGDAEVKNSAVLFSGMLKIVDGDAFWQSYARGVGPGKAYGLGMLNVANG